MKGKPFGGADTGTSEMGSLDNINNDKNPHIHLRERAISKLQNKRNLEELSIYLSGRA